MLLSSRQETQKVPNSRKEISNMSSFSIAGEFFRFMKKRKKWWLLPIIIFVVILGLLIVLTQNAILAPFIYALF